MRGMLCAVAIALAAALPAAARAAGVEENPEAARVDPDFAAGKQAIEAKDWSAAIKSFSSAALRDTRNADIENYLGFAYRNSGDLDSAFRHYEKALTLSPRHRGAHEYVGEAYLMAGNLPKAEEHLAKLKEICLVPCEEYDDLRKKVEEYRARRP
jgi:Flp pilus assembly protein TadD